MFSTYVFSHKEQKKQKMFSTYVFSHKEQKKQKTFPADDFRLNQLQISFISRTTFSARAWSGRTRSGRRENGIISTVSVAS